MNPGLLTVRTDEPIVDAVETMQANAVGSLIVLEEGALQGIVTTSDILRAARRNRGDLRQVSVSGVMSEPVVTIPPHVSVEDTLRAMSHRGLHRLPVADEAEVVGMVTERDILRSQPNLAPVARSLDRELSTIHTDLVRLAGACHDCGHLHHDLREVDGSHYCPRCAGGVRVQNVA